LDGVFLATKKCHWEEIKFDSEYNFGFHFYDLDYSLQFIKKNKRVCVTFDILIKHYSAGSYDESWFKTGLLFMKKWSSFLPVSSKNISKLESKRLQSLNIKDFKNNLSSFGYKYRCYLWFKIYFIYVNFKKSIRTNA
jgi:hypothetical protein